MIGDLVSTVDNFEYGILIAIVIVALLLFSITFFNKKKKLNVLSFIIAAGLIALLTIQFSRLIGACALSNTTSTINNVIGVVSPTLGKYVTSGTSNEISWFIFRRIMWSVIFLIIGGGCIYITMDTQKSRNRSVPTGIQTSRRYHTHNTRRR